MYRARTAEGHSVAVKVLNPGASRTRLEREAASLSVLEHAGVPSVIEVVDVVERAALVTEWASGQRLADIIADGALTPVRSLAIFSKLAEVLDHVHANGVVHRDLSSDNIIIGPNDAVSLVDFGISTGVDTETITTDGTAAGTPRYLAPEVISGAEPTPASDQYSASVVLYEMLTGRWPFPGADTIATVMHHQLHTPITPPSEVNSWLGDGFDDVLERGLSKNPADRFATVTELSNAVASISPRKATPSASGSRPRVGLAVAAIALTAIVIGAWLATRGNETVTAAWSSGTAAGLECNLIVQPDFDTAGVPEGFYESVADRNDISVSGGIDQSAALRVGVTGDFGFYGEIVPIVAGEGYVFRVFVAPTADTQRAAIRLTTLDADFAPAEEGDALGDVELELVPGTSGFVHVELPATAADAMYVVPALIKEGPEGYLLADELVVARLDAGCIPETAS